MGEFDEIRTLIKSLQFSVCNSTAQTHFSCIIVFPYCQVVCHCPTVSVVTFWKGTLALILAQPRYLSCKHSHVKPLSTVNEMVGYLHSFDLGWHKMCLCPPVLGRHPYASGWRLDTLWISCRRTKTCCRGAESRWLQTLRCRMTGSSAKHSHSLKQSTHNIHKQYIAVGTVRMFIEPSAKCWHTLLTPSLNTRWVFSGSITIPMEFRVVGQPSMAATLTLTWA